MSSSLPIYPSDPFKDHDVEKSQEITFGENAKRGKFNHNLVKENTLLRQERDQAQEDWKTSKKEIDQHLQKIIDLKRENERLNELAQSLSRRNALLLRHRDDSDREKLEERDAKNRYLDILDQERKESQTARRESESLRMRFLIESDMSKREIQEISRLREEYDGLRKENDKLLEKLDDSNKKCRELEEIVENNRQRSRPGNPSQSNPKRHELDDEDNYETQGHKRIRLQDRQGKEKGNGENGFFNRLPGTKDVVICYPSNRRRGVEIHYSDLNCLRDGEWLNDRLVEFGICQLQGEYSRQSKQVFFFSTLFYTALSKCIERIDYNSVRKWTHNENIFNYEFAVIPIYEAGHWYLALIFGLTTSKPVIVILDSMKSSRIQTIRNLREYIVEEAKTQHHEIAIQSIGECDVNKLGIPQQQNSSDCALYVLGFIEKFLKDPERFRDTITGNSSILQRSWDMEPPTISKKRMLMFESLSKYFTVEVKNCPINGGHVSPRLDNQHPEQQLKSKANQKPENRKPIDWKEGITLAMLHLGPDIRITLENIRSWMRIHIADKTEKSYDSSSIGVILSMHNGKIWRFEHERSSVYELIRSAKNDEYFEKLQIRFKERKQYLSIHGAE